MPTDPGLTVKDLFDRFDKVIDRFDTQMEQASTERREAAHQCSADIQALRDENTKVHAAIRAENAAQIAILTVDARANRKENRGLNLALIAAVLVLAGVGVKASSQLGDLSLTPAGATTSSTVITTSSSTPVAPVAEDAPEADGLPEEPPLPPPAEEPMHEQPHE